MDHGSRDEPRMVDVSPQSSYLASMKTSVMALIAVVLIAIVGCGTSGQDVCDAFSAKCPSSASGGDDGGVSASITVTCKADAIDEASNKSDVKDCIEKAADCGGAIACLASLTK